MTDSTLSVIIVSYRTGPILQACLAAILSDPAVTQILVIDNGNPATERDFLDRLGREQRRVEIIRPSRNIGFSAACNLGARRAVGAYLAFINPDLIVSTGAMGAIIEDLRSRPDAWIAGARLLGSDGGEQRGGRRDVLTPWRCLVEMTGAWRLFPGHPHFLRFNLHETPIGRGVVDVPTISGACMVLPAARWRQLGGMDEAMYLHVEDIDLCLRVLKSGGRVLYCAHAPVHHLGQSSDVSPLFVEWHKTRGLVRYFHKHFTDTYPRWSLWGMAALMWGRFILRTPFLSLRAARGNGRRHGSAGVWDARPEGGRRPSILSAAAAGSSAAEEG